MTSFNHSGSSFFELQNHTMAWSVYSQSLEEGLVADFDTNLSGLGTELGTGAYNMSEVLALPMFKPESGSSDQIEGKVHCRFQCLLSAATSPACKLNEETVTYLNQGVPYELKISMVENVNEFQGKNIKTQVRVVFSDKRLQYTEKEQIQDWKKTHLGERVLDIDVPLTFGITSFNLSQDELNMIEFLWDPQEAVQCYFKVNCISTEFTAKKHGGEKGVVFRIHVDSFLQENSSDIHLFSASCQIKVFKPKGADRKHKTDRDRMEKKSPDEKAKYQPSYDCTVLKQCEPYNNRPPPVPSNNHSVMDQTSFSSVDSSFSHHSPLRNSFHSTPLHNTNGCAGPPSAYEIVRLIHSTLGRCRLITTCQDDLIHIMGAADGIRLNNALQGRQVRPKLTIYVCQEQQQVYHALYLDRPLMSELKEKLAALYEEPAHKISRVLRQGPTGIRVIVSNEMIQNIPEESVFVLNALTDPEGDTYTIVMK
ncbi:putative transcription factor CP2 [Apostichopus japonicus]|uniref:Putative transcription factor CP2 n=1 Tax=Stichopus japonicus TaxID=307972 RepID=A0A2G8KDG2_STIJA|nr:putative transcription factor CP2 [Apostichopus japonicus]